MTRRAKWWLVALFLVSEILIVGTHWREVKAMNRVLYQTLQKYVGVSGDGFAQRF